MPDDKLRHALVELEAAVRQIKGSRHGFVMHDLAQDVHSPDYRLTNVETAILAINRVLETMLDQQAK